jgi:DNA-directed RNA polymerase I subunit RPA1
MTNQGDYRSFNRKGLSVSSSPFLKMTFESTMEHIISSCVSKEVDSGKSASSKIILGQVPECGTGMFSVMQGVVSQKN